MSKLNTLFAMLTLICFLGLAYTVPRAILLLGLDNIQIAAIDLFFTFWFCCLFKGTYRKG